MSQNHEKETERTPRKSRAQQGRCAACGEPVAGERVRQAIARRGGPLLQALLEGAGLCPRCKRRRAADALAAAVQGASNEN